MICFDRARCEFPPCSRYVSTVLEVCFDRTRDMFRRCLCYVSTVVNVSLHRARGFSLKIFPLWYLVASIRPIQD